MRDELKVKRPVRVAQTTKVVAKKENRILAQYERAMVRRQSIQRILRGI